MKNKKLTIDMVSKKANVSKATISRYINGKYEYMSQETKNRIKGVIEELGYRPNIIAQNLKSKKSGLIGVIISDITSPFFSILLKGIIDTCTKEGYQVIIAGTDGNSMNESDYIISMLDRQVEGIIINTTGDNEKFLETLKSKNIYVSLADRPMQKFIFDTVTTDNESMTAKAIKTLYNCGFERVAFFSEDINKSSIRLLRYNSFIDISSCYVNNPNDLVYIINNHNKDKEYIEYKNAILNFLNINKNIKSAIFAVNGVIMLNLLNTIKKLNLKIPDDIGLCGYDDWGWANLIGDSGISVVSQPSYDVGVKSAELLINRIKYNNNNPVYIELASQLILRGSTDLMKKT